MVQLKAILLGLDFGLDPKRLTHNFPKSIQPPSKLFGLMTRRFLAMSFFKPRRIIDTATTREDLVRAYKRHKVHQLVIRNEQLNRDLADLANGPLRPFFKDPEKSIGYLMRDEHRSNASSSAKLKDTPLPEEIAKKLQEQEWFIYDVIGYPRPLAAREACLKEGNETRVRAGMLGSMAQPIGQHSGNLLGLKGFS